MKAFMRAVLPAIALLAAAGCGGGGGGGADVTDCDKLCFKLTSCATHFDVDVADLLPGYDVTTLNCSVQCPKLLLVCTDSPALFTCAQGIDCQTETLEQVKTHAGTCAADGKCPSP